jgi:uncharacterized protein (TIGR03086 family)
MAPVDLTQSARVLGDLVAGVADDQLTAATPCPMYTLGDLVEHIGVLAVAFTKAADKTSTAADQAGEGDATRLPSDWRQRIPADLAKMAGAWNAPDAWTGETFAGGVAAPAEVMGMIALDELVVHGWDVARSVGADYHGDDAALQVLHGFLAQVPMAAPDASNDGRDAFGSAVDVADDAPVIDRIVGLVGRDPGWAAAGS